MVLTNRPRGAQATMLGGAMTMDAYNAVAMAPDLHEVYRCFREALEVSGVDASEIAYMNAHGPGTAQCDASEAQILDELFPDAKGIFSVKPSDRPLPGGGLGGRDPGDRLRIPDGVRAGAAEGRSGPPPAAGRTHPSGTGSDDQVLDRDGRLQFGDRAGRTRRTEPPLGPRGPAPPSDWACPIGPQAKDSLLGRRYRAYGSLWKLRRWTPRRLLRQRSSEGLPNSQVRPSRSRRTSTSAARVSRRSPGSTTRPRTRSSGRTRSRSSSGSSPASAAFRVEAEPRRRPPAAPTPTAESDDEEARLRGRRGPRRGAARPDPRPAPARHPAWPTST